MSYKPDLQALRPLGKISKGPLSPLTPSPTPQTGGKFFFNNNPIVNPSSNNSYDPRRDYDNDAASIRSKGTYSSHSFAPYKKFNNKHIIATFTNLSPPSLLYRVYLNTVQRVPCHISSLNTHAVYLVLNDLTKQVIMWSGAEAQLEDKKIGIKLAKDIREKEYQQSLEINANMIKEQVPEIMVIVEKKEAERYNILIALLKELNCSLKKYASLSTQRSQSLLNDSIMINRLECVEVFSNFEANQINNSFAVTANDSTHNLSGSSSPPPPQSTSTALTTNNSDESFPNHFSYPHEYSFIPNSPEYSIKDENPMNTSTNSPSSTRLKQSPEHNKSEVNMSSNQSISSQAHQAKENKEKTSSNPLNFMNKKQFKLKLVEENFLHPETTSSILTYEDELFNLFDNNQEENYLKYEKEKEYNIIYEDLNFNGGNNIFSPFSPFSPSPNPPTSINPSKTSSYLNKINNLIGSIPRVPFPGIIYPHLSNGISYIQEDEEEEEEDEEEEDVGEDAENINQNFQEDQLDENDLQDLFDELNINMDSLPKELNNNKNHNVKKNKNKNKKVVLPSILLIKTNSHYDLWFNASVPREKKDIVLKFVTKLILYEHKDEFKEKIEVSLNEMKDKSNDNLLLNADTSNIKSTGNYNSKSNYYNNFYNKFHQNNSIKASYLNYLDYIAHLNPNNNKSQKKRDHYINNLIEYDEDEDDDDTFFDDDDDLSRSGTINGIVYDDEEDITDDLAQEDSFNPYGTNFIYVNKKKTNNSFGNKYIKYKNPLQKIPSNSSINTSSVSNASSIKLLIDMIKFDIVTKYLSITYQGEEREVFKQNYLIFSNYKSPLKNSYQYSFIRRINDYSNQVSTFFYRAYHISSPSFTIVNKLESYILNKREKKLSKLKFVKDKLGDTTQIESPYDSDEFNEESEENKLDPDELDDGVEDDDFPFGIRGAEDPEVVKLRKLMKNLTFIDTPVDYYTEVFPKNQSILDENFYLHNNILFLLDYQEERDKYEQYIQNQAMYNPNNPIPPFISMTPPLKKIFMGEVSQVEDDMLLYKDAYNISNTYTPTRGVSLANMISAMKQDATKRPDILLGWQIELDLPTSTKKSLIFLILSVRTTKGMLSSNIEYLLCDTSRRLFWTPLALDEKKKNKGFQFRLLRKAVNIIVS